MPTIPRPQIRDKAIALCRRGLCPGEVSARLQELYGASLHPRVIGAFARRSGVIPRWANRAKHK